MCLAALTMYHRVEFRQELDKMKRCGRLVFEMRIYCDMDQVLVNFLGGTRKVFGMEFNDARLGSDTDKWRVLAEIPGFWKTLDWMPQAHLLWDRIKHRDTYILSACPPPNESPLCPVEKKEWCVEQLSVSVERVHTVKRGEKALFATHQGQPNLLIDDHPRNCLEWKDAGGIVIEHRTVPMTLLELERYGL